MYMHFVCRCDCELVLSYVMYGPLLSDAFKINELKEKKQITVRVHFIQNFGFTVSLGVANMALALALPSLRLPDNPVILGFSGTRYFKTWVPERLFKRVPGYPFQWLLVLILVQGWYGR